MTQDPKKKKGAPKLPKDIMERSDHDVMEQLFGKRVIREIDKLTGPVPKVSPKGAK